MTNRRASSKSCEGWNSWKDSPSNRWKKHEQGDEAEENEEEGSWWNRLKARRWNSELLDVYRCDKCFSIVKEETCLVYQAEYPPQGNCQSVIGALIVANMGSHRRVHGVLGAIPLRSWRSLGRYCVSMIGRLNRLFLGRLDQHRG